MKFTIKKGRHHAWPLTFGLWFGKNIIRRNIIFYPTCKYDLKDADQADTNKLFGIGYLPHHHTDSARFGWRYDVQQNKFIISAYGYTDEQRIMIDICAVGVMEKMMLVLEKIPGHYEFSVIPQSTLYPVKSVTIPYFHTKHISYPLGFYFGGNKKAPHNMTIEIKKV